MTTINPVLMSTPIKSISFDMPPPDSSSTISQNNPAFGHQNTTDQFNEFKNNITANLKPFQTMVPSPSPNKTNYSHQVAIAAKPSSTSSPNQTPLLAAKPAQANNNKNSSQKNTKTAAITKQSNIQVNHQQQQQQLLVQQQQQQQFQQQIQQFQQLQQQRAIYLNGNLNLSSLFAKNPNQQTTQQILAEAIKQQNVKAPTITPTVNSQIQLSNQQLFQLLTNNNNGNSQNTSAGTVQQAPVMFSQQQGLNKLPVASVKTNNQPKLAPVAANTSVPQSATIISATTTADGQIIFQTVPASTAAAALAAYQQQHNSTTNNNNNNALMHQNTQIYLNQLFNQQNASQFNSNNHQSANNNNSHSNQVLAPKTTDNSSMSQRLNQLQQEQLKQKLLMEEQKFIHLQQQLEQQKHSNSKQSPSSLSPNRQSEYASNKIDLNQTICSLSSSRIASNKSSIATESFNKSPLQDLIIKNERKSPVPFEANRTSDEIDLTSEMEVNDHDISNDQDQQMNDYLRSNLDVNNASKPVTDNKPTKNNPFNKRRGRPRLYAVNPMTGKSMKGRLLSNSPNSKLTINPKASKSPKLYPDTSVNNNGFNQIIINPNNGLIPFNLQSPFQMQPQFQFKANEIAIYAPPNTNSLCNNTLASFISTSDLTIQNSNNQNEVTTTNENAEYKEDENDNSSITNDNTENDQDDALNESDQEEEAVADQDVLDIKATSQESNNNQADCINNNKNKLSPISEISKSISNIKPYKLSPKNMKSQVTLTHVIDGFVIRESSKPFPVKLVKTDLYVDQSNLESNQTIEQDSNAITTDTEATNQFKCTECGNAISDEVIDEKYCSSTCMTRNKGLKSNKEQINQKNKLPENDKQETVNSSPQRVIQSNKNKRRMSQDKPKMNSTFSSQNLLLPTPLVPIQSSETTSSPKKVSNQPSSSQPLFNISNNLNFTNLEQQYPPGDPSEWNCDEVFQFIKCVSGIQVAELFKAQEVDGSALSLIRDDHLVNTMQIKLGPALKIMSRFNELKSKFSSNKQNF